MAPFTQQQVVFVNAATGSGDFVPVLAKSGRVVITATRTAMERNESEFLGVFTKALNSEEADADKDGRLSVLEAFRYARAEVAKSYERTNRMLTEHAVLSDSIIAGRITFGGKAVSANPRVAALIAERQILESQVAALRTRKATMAADAYDAELERLLLAIAEKTQAIKAAGRQVIRSGCARSAADQCPDGPDGCDIAGVRAGSGYGSHDARPMGHRGIGGRSVPRPWQPGRCGRPCASHHGVVPARRRTQQRRTHLSGTRVRVAWCRRRGGGACSAAGV